MDAIKKFFDLRDKFLTNDDIDSLAILEALLIHWFRTDNDFKNDYLVHINFSKAILEADAVLSSLGYHHYSIDINPDEMTITLRNNL